MRDLILRHKIFFGTIIFLVLLVIPLTVFQVQQQQELRQRAEGGDVKLTLSTLTDSKHPNDIFDVNVALKNPQKSDISAVEFTLSSSNDNIKIIEFKPSSYQGYTNEITNSSLQFTGLNTGESEIRSESIPLGTLTLQALAIGTSTLSFSNITVTASLSPDPLSTDSQDANYSISQQTTTGATSEACGDNNGRSFGACPSANQTCVKSGDPTSTDGITYSCIFPTPTPLQSTSRSGDACSVTYTTSSTQSTPPCDKISYGGGPNNSSCSCDWTSKVDTSSCPGIVCMSNGVAVCNYYICSPRTISDISVPTSPPGQAPTATPTLAPTTTPVTVPTPTLAPTSPPVPGGTTLTFSSIKLDGITDGTVKKKIGNIYIRLVGSDTVLATGKMNHSQNSLFTGSINLPASFTSGYYTISGDNTLRKLIGFIAPSTSPVTLPSIALSLGDISSGDAASDFEPDNRIDIFDYSVIKDCFGSNYESNKCKAHPKRAAADLNGDSIISGIDFNIFIKNIGAREGD